MLNIAYSWVNPNWLKGSYWLNKAPFSTFSQAGTDPSVGNFREEKSHLHFVFTRSTVGQRTVLGAGQHSSWVWGINRLLSSPAWDTVGWQRSPCCCHCTSPWGGLLLLWGCLHCQGTGKFPNILLVQQEKALGCSKTNCSVLETEQGNSEVKKLLPQPGFIFLSAASSGGYLFSASISAWLLCNSLLSKWSNM